MLCNTYTIEYEGLKLVIVATQVGDDVKLEITAVEGYADINAIYWSNGDDVNDGDGSMKGFTGAKSEASLNMNGTGMLWDDGQKFSNPGLGTDGEDKATFVSEGETLELTLCGVSLEDMQWLGVRATSSSNPEGSIKGVAECEPPPPQGDDFPEWAQDISNVVLVFDTESGDTKPRPDGDGYYTVKIDEWPEDASDDLDDSIDDILAWLVANDPNIDEDTELLGAIIKGGQEDTNFYAYGDNNTNGTDPDPLPPGLGLELPEDDPDTPNNEAAGNATPTNAIDTTYDYDDVFA